MNFYHCTTHETGKKFIHFKDKKKKLKKIRSSKFDYISCLNEWITCLTNDEILPEKLVERHSFPRKYYGDHKVYFLGNGFYCFSEQHKDESPIYARKRYLDAIFKVGYNKEFNYFDMEENKDELINFLSSDLLIKHLKESYLDPDVLHSVNLIIELLILEIEDEYYYNPHAAAMVIELFIAITGNDFDVVSNSFLIDPDSLKYDNFSAIRNIELITNLEYSYELTRQIRV